MDYIVEEERVSKFFELCFLDISFQAMVHLFAAVMLFFMVVANFVLIVLGTSVVFEDFSLGKIVSFHLRNTFFKDFLKCNLV